MTYLLKVGMVIFSRQSGMTYLASIDGIDLSM